MEFVYRILPCYELHPVTFGLTFVFSLAQNPTEHVAPESLYYFFFAVQVARVAPVLHTDQRVPALCRVLLLIRPLHFGKPSSLVSVKFY